MVVLFQPFTGKLIYFYFLLLNHIIRKACALRKYLYLYAGNWTQILGVFASKGNVKSVTLAKIVVETTVLAEKAGLFVDCITCDGASWNRSMWRLFGIQGEILFECNMLSCSYNVVLLQHTVYDFYKL